MEMLESLLKLLINLRKSCMFFDFLLLFGCLTSTITQDVLIFEFFTSIHRYSVIVLPTMFFDL